MTIKLKNCLLIAIICSLFLSLVLFTGFFSNIQLKLSDNLYGGKTALDGIVIVAIDDESLQEIGRWPWDRSVFAKALDQLHESKVIGMDVAFFESSTVEEDSILGEAASKVNIVVPVEYLTFAKEENKIIGKRLLEPIKELSNSHKGYVNIITDADGVTRAVNMDISGQYDNFAYVVYKEYWKKEISSKSSRFLVNFVGIPGSFKRYSITDVINERISPSEFKNKLVLIGSTSPDMHDDYFVPTSKGKAMPGVEIHANTIQTLIKKDFLMEVSSILMTLIILIVSLLIALTVFKFGIKGATILSPILIIIYLFLAIYLFNYGIILNIIYIPVAILLAYIAETLYFYLSSKKEEQKVKGAFSKYVSPAVMDEVIKDPEKLKLGGARKEITVFFSDIRGFTTISEGLSPEKLVHILNEYLTAMTDIIMKHTGVVDKYIGDAIMAFWGAPLEQPDHAEMACSTAVDMMKKLDELQSEWKKQNFPEIKIGIGLNTGSAVIGNMGSYRRFDYTAMGDTINIGSRLEGLTKAYGVNIIVSESTKKETENKFIFRKLDLVRVKGKRKPVVIYELIGRKGEDVDLEAIKTYEKGLEFYLDKKWGEAIIEFNKLNDFASKEFVNRCEIFKKTPPPKDWKGVWIMRSK